MKVFKKVRLTVGLMVYLEGDTRVSVRNKLFREVVANLLIHREYSNAFPAKLIIKKDTVTTENSNRAHGYGEVNIINFTPFPKNPVIAGVFKEIGWADELGSGIRNIEKYAKIYSNSKPVFIEGDVFKTIIKIKSDDKKVTITSDDKSVTIKSVTIKSDDNKKAIIDYLTENESGKNSDLAQLLGVKSTRVKQLIYKLIEDDIIVTEGANRNRVYKLKSKDN